MSARERTRVGVVGATGYVGAELARLLVGHPAAELVAASSRSQAGTRLDALYPHLASRCDLVVSGASPLEMAQDCDVVFLALPHGASVEAVSSLFGADGQRLCRARIIDMSGDFRLDSAAVYAQAYGREHARDDLLARAVYGLSEWRAADVAAAELVANPGCFATAIGLALAPLAAAASLPARVTVVAMTGSTGSGAQAKATTHHPERATNVKLYKVLDHQHQPEIETMLRGLGGETRLSFVPVSAPMTHGIYAVLHLQHDAPEQLAAQIEEAYRDSAFVRVRRGSTQLNWVIGSNFADLGLTVGEGELVIASAIDNMLKGAAGQGIQNMNLMLGLEPTTGLGMLPSLP